MPVEIEVHTVPHFKGTNNAKVESEGLECDEFLFFTKLGHLLHKSRPVPFVSSSSVCILVHTRKNPKCGYFLALSG